MRVAWMLIVAAACGDNQLPDEVSRFEGTSGSRLKLNWYLYQDGTRQLETQAFYDTRLHHRCTQREWIDGVTRCTPLADATIFSDADCMIELGSAHNSRTPTFFVGHERIDGVTKPARLIRAGSITTRPEQFFEMRDGTCTAVPEPETFSYFELGEHIAWDTMAEVWPDEQMMDDRLGLDLIQSSEGLNAPIGFRDHVLDLACLPQRLTDGTAACVPTESTTAAHFADPDCADPVVIAPAAPRVVNLADSHGCPLYRNAGAELERSLVFRREGGACMFSSIPTGEHAFRIGAPLELAAVERTVETVASRRLQRIRVEAGALATFDLRLFDTATRTECKSFGNGELAVCVPSNAATAKRVFVENHCGVEAVVADLPRISCTKPAFAVTNSEDDTFTIHAIGPPMMTPTYFIDANNLCRARPNAPDFVTHSLGPSIPPGTFIGGVVFSER